MYSFQRNGFIFWFQYDKDNELFFRAWFGINYIPYLDLSITGIFIKNNFFTFWRYISFFDYLTGNEWLNAGPSGKSYP